MSTDGVGVWAYAVIQADSADDRVAGLQGVAGEPVRALATASLAAAVGTVRLGEFGEEALRRNLEDLDWLAAKARAHDGVISAIARSGPVIPVRMATLYLNDSRVEQLLQDRRDDFHAALNLVTGRDELGVKAYADPKKLAGQDPQDPGSRSGTAYLLRRRREIASQEQAYRVAAAAAERIHAALLAHAVDGKRKPASDRSLSGRDAWTVLNGTYLVDSSSVADFRAAVAAVAEQSPGIELEITGPWPPYSFAGDVVTS
ncbi:GvpL/GvpF family gas vesicle protein [Mycobacterium sp. 1465703.0]|uniref:GvpL/GvpF family gas vesicle protein n=1 Tax=Mycobacterium sp. 1465703.0 TaxID=1834078 RepID=UPI0007FC6589|nr:GvpL/GvpF family gas vesicle protein [Mycobacterium sp. 1465703.0]OBI98664.1 gas vesicle protein GvpFL [Mycobacterium sp. 1465703.0]